MAAECRNGSSATSAAGGEPAVSDVATQEQRDPLRDLPDCARALPIGVLHLGSKTRWLRGEGFATVGDLVNAAASRLRRILAVGPRTRRLVEERLLCLATATDASGVDWDRYCAAAGITLIPSGADIGSGEDLLASLPRVIAELGEHCDGTDRDILLTRLSRAPREQSKLEEIAGRCRPIVSRERIRQREAKLLRRLGGALLHEDGESTDLHFRPSFSEWWRRAAAEFSGVEEIGFDEFVSRLSRVWSVTVPALTQELPFILAIVTGEPQMPADFRTAVRVSPLLYGPLRQDVRAIPLRHLRFGRRAGWLSRRGLATLGDLLDVLRSVSLPQEVLDQLNTIAGCIAEDGSFAWDRYRRAVTTETVPPEPPADAPAFASGSADTFRAILERVRVPGRAVDIFEMRTRHPPATRKTLDATARLLGSHGPSIKREETILLEELHEIVVQHEFSELGFWLDETWLRFCRDAHRAYESADGDHDRFVSGLCLRWAVTPRQVEAALPSLWAVFSGYPDRRRRDAAVEPDTGAEAAPPPVRIRLRGFRTVH